VRGVSGGNEQNARDREIFGGRARNSEMGVMDRIKSSAKNRQARNNYTFSMVTELILTGVFGRSEESRGVREILSTTS
jgi:hypothetical protein